jgi:hypothetical protein
MGAAPGYALTKVIKERELRAVGPAQREASPKCRAAPSDLKLEWPQSRSHLGEEFSFHLQKSQEKQIRQGRDWSYLCFQRVPLAAEGRMLVWQLYQGYQ